MLILFQPCGMVAPHNHPRATEYLMNIAGPPLAAGSFNENGSPFFGGNLTAGQVVVLPLGSVHYVSNEGCDPALIAAAFK
jgi:quercetin dioxygenase-like cupin family protein